MMIPAISPESSSLNMHIIGMPASSYINVFIDDKLDDNQVEMLLQSILALDNVQHAEFISPDEALMELAEILGDYDGILMSLRDNNPLRRSFRVELKDTGLQHETLEIIRQMQGVHFARP